MKFLHPTPVPSAPRFQSRIHLFRTLVRCLLIVEDQDASNEAVFGSSADGGHRDPSLVFTRLSNRRYLGRRQDRQGRRPNDTQVSPPQVPSRDRYAAPARNLDRLHVHQHMTGIIQKGPGMQRAGNLHFMLAVRTVTWSATSGLRILDRQ